MLSFWFYLLAVIILTASFFVPGGPTGAGWTLYPPQAILEGMPGNDLGIILMLVSLAVFIIAFTMGGLNYVTTVLQARTRGMTLMRMPCSVWRSEEHTSETPVTNAHTVCRLMLEKKKKNIIEHK